MGWFCGVWRDRVGRIRAEVELVIIDSVQWFLAELVMAECDDRDSRRAVRRVNAAGFPRAKRVDEFDSQPTPTSPRRPFTSSLAAPG